MTARHPDLDGASVFVTGGGSGIGAVLVRAFLEQRSQVAFIDLAEGGPAGALAIRGDVTDTDALTAAMEQASKAHGGLTVLVTCAADDQRVAAEDVDAARWDRSLALNLDHYFHANRIAAGLMTEGGSIVNYSSITYRLGSSGMAPYMTANAGIAGMTRGLAREWGGRGIRVNAVAPGWVLTDKQREKWATPDALEAFRARQCLPRLLEPEDMIGPTLFLASSASAAVTGQVLVADAGVVHG